MSESGNQADPPLRSAPDITRRTFFRRLGSGLAVAVPSLYGLVHASPASADEDKRSSDYPLPGPCSLTYEVYQGHSCGPRNSCPYGNDSNCYGVYYRYSRVTGQFCGSFSSNEGRCASK
jgi:hypothetical protein